MVRLLCRPSRRGTRLALALLLVSGPLAGGTLVERILVHVNTRVVTQSQFDARVQAAVVETGGRVEGERLEQLKKAVLGELVNEALLEDRARDLDLVTSDAEVEEQVNRLKEANNVTTEEQFQQALAASGLTPERLREQLKRTLTVQRVVGREVNSKVDLSDDALRLIYENEKETWRIPEKVHIAEILVSRSGDGSSAERRAKEASEKLAGGMKWDVAVGLYSDGTTREKGGDLGVVARGELVPELEAVAFSLPVGGVSDPVAARHGWHIVKVLEKTPVSYKPFAEVKADIFKREQETQFQKKLAEYLEKLKRDAVISVAEEARAYYTPPAPEVPKEAAAGVAGEGDAGEPLEGGSEQPPERASRRERGFEVTPTAGFRIGGTASTTYSEYIESLDVSEALSFGLTLEFPILRTVNLELFWSHQDTELTASYRQEPPAGYGEKLTHLNVDTIHLGGLWLLGREGAKVRPYMDLLFGVTILTPAPQFSTMTRFSGSIGGGAKFRLSDALGARLGIRFMPVYVNATSSGYTTCDPWYGCYTYYDSNYLLQWDAYTGLTYRF